jgi:SNF2 family DNA or RNA helicase
MRLEQRIGRVDRIGQAHAVRAINLVFDGSVEHRVREVLEEKLDQKTHNYPDMAPLIILRVEVNRE